MVNFNDTVAYAGAEEHDLCTIYDRLFVGLRSRLLRLLTLTTVRVRAMLLTVSEVFVVSLMA